VPVDTNASTITSTPPAPKALRIWASSRLRPIPPARIHEDGNPGPPTVNALISSVLPLLGWGGLLLSRAEVTLPLAANRL
jgi:hypothetical protein